MCGLREVVCPPQRSEAGKTMYTSVHRQTQREETVGEEDAHTEERGIDRDEDSRKERG